MKISRLFFAFAAFCFATSQLLAAPSSSQYQPNDAYDITATVAASGTTSSAIDLHGTDLMGIFVPSTFDGTTITFTASTDLAGTYVTVQDGAGATYTLTGAASTYVPISNLAITSGLRYIKIVTGTSQSTTSTVFTLALRPI